MHLFYVKDLSGDVITLDGDESRHCTRVLRMKPGDEIGIVDGRGTWCRAHLLEVHPAETTATIVHRQEGFGKRPFHLHIAVAPTKNIDRFEWFLEKATECGVDEITPLICEKSERRVLKTHRLEKIMVAAMKQSLRAYLPKLNPAHTLAEFISQPLPEVALIAHCAGGEKFSTSESCEPGRNTLVLVGPEGDFTAAEIAAAQDRGFKAISMGAHRLRTETAALALCIQWNTANGLL
ncbi:MAG: RsmE family RNA methyltransferase [Bacteroidales bacterium]|nr:RsmE family RNA methyltransferase [Bacteroidales bacterium]